MRPFRHQILFKPLPPQEYSESGIFIPESARKVSNKGVIVEVGLGTPKRPMRLQKGMVCYRVKNWGEERIIDGEKYYLMDEQAILAIE